MIIWIWLMKLKKQMLGHTFSINMYHLSSSYFASFNTFYFENNLSRDECVVHIISINPAASLLLLFEWKLLHLNGLIPSIPPFLDDAHPLWLSAPTCRSHCCHFSWLQTKVASWRVSASLLHFRVSDPDFDEGCVQDVANISLQNNTSLPYCRKTLNRHPACPAGS